MGAGLPRNSTHQAARLAGLASSRSRPVPTLYVEALVMLMAAAANKASRSLIQGRLELYAAMMPVQSWSTLYAFWGCLPAPEPRPVTSAVLSFIAFSPFSVSDLQFAQCQFCKRAGAGG